jgi:hypothetical protein
MNFQVLISRPEHVNRARWLLRHNPVVAILGPRQIGKSTLARQIAQGRRNVTMFDLERPADLRRLEDPERVLCSLKGLVVLDEVQRRPEICSAEPRGCKRARPGSLPLGFT